MNLKPNKCQLGYDTMDFLGHKLSNDRISPKEEAIEKIVEMPRPTTKKQISGFLGAVNYYREFIPDCGKIMQPLIELTKKRAKEVVDWNPKLEKFLKELTWSISEDTDLNR